MATRAADIKIIANSSVTAASISADEIEGVFLATKPTLSDGGHVEPVLLKGGAGRGCWWLLKITVPLADGRDVDLRTGSRTFSGLLPAGRSLLRKTAMRPANHLPRCAVLPRAIIAPYDSGGLQPKMNRLRVCGGWNC